MELDIWSGDWGLPSIDPKCLQVLAYTRFSGVPLKVHPTNNPWGAFSRSLPVFRHTINTKLTNFQDIVAHLHKHNYSADLNLSKKELADVAAYSSMLNQNIEPALVSCSSFPYEC